MEEGNGPPWPARTSFLPSPRHPPQSSPVTFLSLSPFFFLLSLHFTSSNSDKLTWSITRLTHQEDTNGEVIEVEEDHQAIEVEEGEEEAEEEDIKQNTTTTGGVGEVGITIDHPSMIDVMMINNILLPPMIDSLHLLPDGLQSTIIQLCKSLPVWEYDSKNPSSFLLLREGLRMGIKEKGEVGSVWKSRRMRKEVKRRIGMDERYA
jgi:hypothetical protein